MGQERPTISHEERMKVLNQEIIKHQAQGKRIESQVEYHVVLVQKQDIHHVLHFILTVCTMGFWLIVWAIMVLQTKDIREILQVDEYGHVTLTPAKS